MIHYYEKLDVWKRSVELSIELYKFSSTMRDFGLKDQMQRAAVSIPSNIAEGSQRDSNKEFIRFLNIAKGSAAELNTQLIISHRLNLIGDKNLAYLQNELNEILKMVSGLINSLKDE